ncbi:NUDIX hydrolase [Kribbella sp. NPDC049584]|uniref:NUDIX hydrolase n=1 Tax=Kribbella sp. NPDC049584 TaxID=3154833 RepID=UPI0034183EEA
MTSPQRPIEMLEEREVYRNRFITVYDDEVQFASGARGDYLRIVEAEGARGVVALPLFADLVGLVKTYRYALGAFEWSLPRGFAHSVDTSLTVLTELNEELGADPVDLQRLGELNPNSGLLASTVDVFVARYAAAEATPTDTDEIAEVRWIPVTQLFDEIRDGQISDAFTLSALCLAQVSDVLPTPPCKHP